jgi:hypothetical protein
MFRLIGGRPDPAVVHPEGYKLSAAERGPPASPDHRLIACRHV